MIASNQLSKMQHEHLKAMNKKNRDINLGYALVTFSHADEAKQAVINSRGEINIDCNFVSIMHKGKLDHSELDRSYFLRKLSNESKLVDLR